MPDNHGMVDRRTDEIAREAARLLQTGRAETIGDATRRAADWLGYSHAALPGAGRVRKHAQAMAMQSLGGEAYQLERIKVWNIAEQVMTVFEHTLPDARSLLVGRAAQGLIDAGVTIHIRIYTRRTDIELAQILKDFDYADWSFRSVSTQLGALQQLRTTDDGYEVAITRCVPEMISPAYDKIDLLTGKPVFSLTLPALRRKLDERGSTDDVHHPAEGG